MTVRRMAVLVNPMAGAGLGAKAGERVLRELETAGIHATEFRSTAKGDVLTQSRAIVRDNFEVVVSVGGDGTLHEVVNGLLTSPEDSKLPAIGMIPVGTGNDYIKMHGGPFSLEQAIQQVIRGQEKAVDIGVIRDGATPPRYFINNIGGAFLAQSQVQTDKTHSKKGKRGGGKMRYVIGGLKALMKHTPVPVNVAINGESFPGPFSVVHVGIGRFCGGGVDFIPDDGDLSVCLVKAQSALSLASKWLFLERGGLTRSSSVIRRSCQRLELTGHAMLVHADGELYQIANTTATVEVLPGRLRVLA
ncbi:MAG: YegS/Rv2252/BmrU family lipid kinase [Planctomycetota bacterium]|nr:YegS/Rv2252/BmrU family lipid kinase [Planctomycetota bacterium]